MAPLSTPINPIQFSTVASTATVDLMRTFKATNRHAFLGQLDNGISNWKADHIKATIIAEKFKSKSRDVALEKNKWIRESKRKAEDDGIGVEDIAADKDQQEQWDLRTEQAADGLKSARYWRRYIDQVLRELARARVCWDNMWYLYDLGLDETSETLKENWTGLLRRYSTLLQIQRNAAASELKLCTAMGVKSMSKLKVVDEGKRMEGESCNQPTKKPDFVWESYRSGN